MKRLQIFCSQNDTIDRLTVSSPTWSKALTPSTASLFLALATILPQFISRTKDQVFEQCHPAVVGCRCDTLEEEGGIGEEFTGGVPNAHLSAVARLYLAVAHMMQRKGQAAGRHFLQLTPDPWLSGTEVEVQLGKCLQG